MGIVRPGAALVLHAVSTWPTIVRVAQRWGTIRGYGAVGSASPWHGEGQGFESPYLHSVEAGTSIDVPASSVTALVRPIATPALPGPAARCPRWRCRACSARRRPSLVPHRAVTAGREPAQRGHGLDHPAHRLPAGGAVAAGGLGADAGRGRAHRRIHPSHGPTAGAVSRPVTPCPARAAPAGGPRPGPAVPSRSGGTRPGPVRSST